MGRLSGALLMESRQTPKVCTLTEGLVQYRGMLFGFIYSLVRDVAVAEEILQEVAVVAMEKERRADEIIREPAAWLKEVVRRLVQAGFRTRQGRLITLDQEYLEQVSLGFQDAAGGDFHHTRLDALGSCLERMNDRHRALLQRRYVAGDSYDDIAKGSNRSPGALRVLVHRLQRQLADCVEQRLATEGH